MPLPLEGLRVLDLTRALAGPFCTMILGDLGADVIKTESIPTGDMCRSWAPFHDGTGVYYLSINRNKRGLALNFRDPRGLETVQRLARKADILVENFKPGTMVRMGLEYDSLKNDNQGLIYASITGFGSEGPYGHWPGYDQIVQGMSGMMSISGQVDGPPTRFGVPLGDLTAGMWAALGITAAVAQRHTTGHGQRVETSLLASLIGMLCVQGQRYLSLGEVAGRIGNDHPVIYPYGAFEAKDGIINIAAGNQQQWATLCRNLDLDDLVEDRRFHDNTARSNNRDDLRRLMNEKLRTKTIIEWTKTLMDKGVPTGPVYDLQQALEDHQVRETGMIETVEHPVIGPLELLSNPLRLGTIGPRTVRMPPPALGEHSIQVLKEFGFTDGEITTLKNAGVLQAKHEEKP